MSRVAFHTDNGPRENLEDTGAAFRLTNGVSEPRGAVVATVFDGVGGNNYGEVASALAQGHILSNLAAFLAVAANQNNGARIPPDEILGVLCNTFAQANQAILQQVAENPHLKGMATTAVCVLTSADLLYVAWAGDSRCYLHSEGTLHRITHDHSQAVELIEQGVITPEEARDHPCAHTITRYLGQSHGFQADTRLWRLAPGDVALLCTDGLTDVVSDEEIARQIAACKRGLFGLDNLPVRLVEQALRAGTQDNVTVLCWEHDAAGGPTFTDPNRTLTEAYSVELAKTMQQLTQEDNHA